MLAVLKNRVSLNCVGVRCSFFPARPLKKARGKIKRISHVPASKTAFASRSFVFSRRWATRDCSVLLFFFFLSFISLIADGPHHYHPACGHKGSPHLFPVHALQFFYRDASSALLKLVNQRLNFTYSRSHAFRYERKNTNPTLVRIELTTSVLADVQLTY